MYGIDLGVGWSLINCLSTYSDLPRCAKKIKIKKSQKTQKKRVVPLFQGFFGEGFCSACE